MTSSMEEFWRCAEIGSREQVQKDKKDWLKFVKNLLLPQRQKFCNSPHGNERTYVRSASVCETSRNKIPFDPYQTLAITAYFQHRASFAEQSPWEGQGHSPLLKACLSVCTLSQMNSAITIFKIHFSIILSTTTWSPKRFIPFKLLCAFLS